MTAFLIPEGLQEEVDLFLAVVMGKAGAGDGGAAEGAQDGGGVVGPDRELDAAALPEAELDLRERDPRDLEGEGGDALGGALRIPDAFEGDGLQSGEALQDRPGEGNLVLADGGEG